MERVSTLAPPPPLAPLIASGPLALFVDFDGTLVDIAPSPDAITIPAELASRLTALSERLDGRLAIVSGRAIENLEAHCGVLRIACAGSHGAQRRTADGVAIGMPPATLAGPIVSEIASYAQSNGIAYEAKPHGAALHTRSVPHLESACFRFVSELAGRHGLAVKRGKHVAELVAQGCDKGAAVRAFMVEEPFAQGMPVFVGDDVTDEDGFAACARLGGFGVAVGERPSRAARYGLAGPAQVRHWLRL